MSGAEVEPSWSEDTARVSHVVVIAIFSFLATIAVGFRLWARRIQRSGLEMSDYLCIAGLICTLALAVFTIHSNVYWDLGGDLTQVGNPNAILSLVIHQVQALITGQILWVTSIFLLRSSIIALYIRIFHTKSFRLTCYIVLGVNAAYFVSVVLASCLICHPIAANWDPNAGTCGSQKALDIYIGVMNLLLDVCVVILPMPVLWRLQMDLSKKLVLSGIFGMGIIICVLTLIRIWVTSLIHDNNAQSIYSMIALLTCLEATLGVINACLPVMRPVFTKFGNSKIWSTFITGNSNTANTTTTGEGRGGVSSIGGSFSHRFTHRNRSNRGYSHDITSNRSSKYKHNNNAFNKIDSWPQPSHQGLAPRFVGSKPAKMMFGHSYPLIVQRSSNPASDTDATTLASPSQQQHYDTTTHPWEKHDGFKGITSGDPELKMDKDLPPSPPLATPSLSGASSNNIVRRDWDVERGDGGDALEPAANPSQPQSGSGNGIWSGRVRSTNDEDRF